MQVVTNHVRKSAETFIRNEARKLIGNAGLTKSDLDDLCQELWVHVLTGLENFDSEKSSATTFILNIVKRRARTMRRDRSREWRRSESFSLDMEYNDEEEGVTSFHNKISPETNRLSSLHRSDVEQLELTMDVEQVISNLPIKLRRLCEALKTMGVKEAAKSLGINRRTVTRQIQIIRLHMKNHGLQDYFEKPCPLSTLNGEQ